MSNYPVEKKCNKCEETKLIEFFYLDKRRDQHQTICKSCKTKQTIICNRKNKDRINARKREWRKNNPIQREKDRVYSSNYARKSVEQINLYNREARKNNPEKFRAKDKKRYNTPKRKAYEKNYRKANKDKLNAGRFGDSKYNAWRRKYKKERYWSDIQYKISCNFQSRIRVSLKDKTESTRDLIGTDIKTLISHLEKQFTEGMSWDNHSLHGWHMDHIRPICSFDLTDKNQRKECFNYKNLQPLWAVDNIKKGGTYHGK